jgi:hypothetical protein
VAQIKGRDYTVPPFKNALFLLPRCFGGKSAKGAPKRRKRHLVHPWNRLSPDASDRGSMPRYTFADFPPKQLLDQSFGCFTFEAYFVEAPNILRAWALVCLFRTLRDRDVAREPTWTYLRRF